MILNRGQIENEGTYEQLVAKGVDFKQYVSEEEEVEEDVVDTSVLEDDSDGEGEVAQEDDPSKLSPIKTQQRGRSRYASVSSAVSFHSTNSVDFRHRQQLEADKGKGNAEEKLEKGTVDWIVYWRFFLVGGGFLGLPLLLLVNFLAQVDWVAIFL